MEYREVAMHVSGAHCSVGRTQLQVKVGIKLSRGCKLHYKNRHHKVKILNDSMAVSFQLWKNGTFHLA